MNDNRIRLTPASEDDFEFSYQVKKAAEGDLIRLVFGWDETVQRQFHRREWMESPPSIIRLDGLTIGTVAVVDTPGHVDFGRFFILPEYHNRGIGTYILREVLRRADENGAPVRLATLGGNRAEALYQRLGFRCVREDRTHRYWERQSRRHLPDDHRLPGNRGGAA